MRLAFRLLATRQSGSRARTFPLAVVALTLSALALRANAFSKNNHEVVGDVAVLYLQQTPHGRQTLLRVQSLLGAQTLGQAAHWADDVKQINEAQLAQLPASDEKAVFLTKVKNYIAEILATLALRALKSNHETTTLSDC